MENLFDRIKHLEELADRQVSSLRRIEMALTTERLDFMKENAELRKNNERLKTQLLMQNHNGHDNHNDQPTDMEEDHEDESLILTDSETDDSTMPRPMRGPIVKSEFKIDGTAESIEKFRNEMLQPLNFSSVVILMQRNVVQSESVFKNLSRALVTIITHTSVGALIFMMSGSQLGNEIAIFMRRGSCELTAFGHLFKAAGVLNEEILSDRRKLAGIVASVKIKLRNVHEKKAANVGRRASARRMTAV